MERSEKTQGFVHACIILDYDITILDKLFPFVHKAIHKHAFAVKHAKRKISEPVDSEADLLIFSSKLLYMVLPPRKPVRPSCKAGNPVPFPDSQESMSSRLCANSDTCLYNPKLKIRFLQAGIGTLTNLESEGTPAGFIANSM